MSKRGSRHTIRLPIKLAGGLMQWSAAAAGRAARIWTGTISDGYLPAEFPGPQCAPPLAKSRKSWKTAWTLFVRLVGVKPRFHQGTESMIRPEPG